VPGFFHGAFTNVLRGTGGALTLILYDHLQQRLMGRGSLFQYSIPSKIPEEEKKPTEVLQDLHIKEGSKKPCIFKDGRDTFCNF